MATKLTKMVSREVFFPHQPKPVIFSLNPETKTLEVKEKGRRKVWTLPLQTLWVLIVRDGTEKRK
jgi:hypothetical protein